MNFDQFETLGKTMGETLKAEPYTQAQELWNKISDVNERQEAKQRFFKAAEAVLPVQVEEEPKKKKKKKE